VNAYADDDTVTIPSPYQGLTVRKGDREVNVHSVKDGEVYYGLYVDDPEGIDGMACIGLFRKPLEEFIDQVGGHMARGDAAVFSMIATRPAFELAPPSTCVKRG
jgi:hypothetical protein